MCRLQYQHQHHHEDAPARSHRGRGKHPPLWVCYSRCTLLCTLCAVCACAVDVGGDGEAPRAVRTGSTETKGGWGVPCVKLVRSRRRALPNCTSVYGRSCSTTAALPQLLSIQPSIGRPTQPSFHRSLLYFLFGRSGRRL